jgi:hypothetical protein
VSAEPGGLPGKAPRKVYLHIGLHKTGTTYLQNVLRANRQQLREREVHFPGGPGEPVQAFGVWDLQGRRPRGVTDRRISGTWQRLVDNVNTCGLPTALISEERLSLSTLNQVGRAVKAFVDSEVHVVVTARDLGRVAVSAWQEEVKNDETWTWQQFADAIRDPRRAATNPARGFWLRQDLAAICATWESAVPPERLHVVTVPRAGSPADELMRRFASVVGFDAAILTEQPRWNNETVGVAATEVIRLVNERLGGRLNKREHDKVVKLTLVPALARTAEQARFTLPDEEIPWVSDRADVCIAQLAQRGYPVTGALDELRPERRDGGRRPDDATDSELLQTALDALATLAEEYATSWWQRKRRTVEQVAEARSLGSRARQMMFEGQRRAAELADRNPLAARAMSAVLKRRERARAKARHITT